LISDSSILATQQEIGAQIIAKKETLDNNLKKVTEEELLKNEPLWFNHYIKAEDVQEFKALKV